MRANEFECAVKNCDQDAPLGMTVRLGGLRIELFLCEPHFDILDACDDWSPARDVTDTTPTDAPAGPDEHGIGADTP